MASSTRTEPGARAFDRMKRGCRWASARNHGSAAHSLFAQLMDEPMQLKDNAQPPCSTASRTWTACKGRRYLCWLDQVMMALHDGCSTLRRRDDASNQLARRVVTPSVAGRVARVPGARRKMSVDLLLRTGAVEDTSFDVVGGCWRTCEAPPRPVMSTRWRGLRRRRRVAEGVGGTSKDRGTGATMAGDLDKGRTCSEDRKIARLLNAESYEGHIDRPSTSNGARGRQDKNKFGGRNCHGSMAIVALLEGAMRLLDRC